MGTRILTAIGTLVVLTGGAIFLFPSVDRRFDESFFNQIREGMTEREVETIVGHPPGDYRPRRYRQPGHFVSPSDPVGFCVKCSGLSPQELTAMEDAGLIRKREWMPKGPKNATQKRWLGKSWGIVVAFDHEGLVIHHALLEMVPPRLPDDIFSKLKWYLGL
jgi:hypothetical protein